MPSIDPAAVSQVAQLSDTARTASRRMALLSRADKDAALHAMADALVAATDRVVAANAEDLARGRESGMAQALLDRLTLDEKRVAAGAAALRVIAALPDPVGEVVRGSTLPNGLQIRQVRVPLYTVPGNHENFGIERDRSHVAADHPLYGRAMYRHYRGPDYYSFNYGGIHFVGLNSVDIDDQWYYGHVDSVQAAWLARDLAAISAATPVVTFNHIPFFTAVETINGYMDGPPAPTAITVRGRTSFRHAVANAGEILALVRPHPYPLALGGHMHVRERLRYEGVPTRFEQAAAVVGPSEGSGLGFPSGVTVYRVHGGIIDEGTFVPLDTPQP